LVKKRGYCTDDENDDCRRAITSDDDVIKAPALRLTENGKAGALKRWSIRVDEMI